MMMHGPSASRFIKLPLINKLIRNCRIFNNNRDLILLNILLSKGCIHGNLIMSFKAKLMGTQRCPAQNCYGLQHVVVTECTLAIAEVLELLAKFIHLPNTILIDQRGSERKRLDSELQCGVNTML